MAVFLFVTACMALFAGFVGLVAGCRPQTTGRKKDPRVSVASWSSRGGFTRANTTRRGPAHGKEVNFGTMIEP